MNAFHVVGGLLAIWAVVVSFLGITREGFPKTAVAERLVMLISVVLVCGAIGTAVYVGATEGGKENEATVLLSPG
jgi:hypothetical protein